MSASVTDCDIAVIGAGIVGLGVAHAARRRGLDVIVVDRCDDIVGASVRNFGHACIGAQTGEAARYASLARPLWLELARDAGFWLRACGSVVAARHEDEVAVLEAARAQDANGIRMQTASEVRDHAPVGTSSLLGGALLQDDLQTDPRSAAHAIARLLARRGVEFRMRTSALRLVSDAVSGGVRVQTTRGAVIARHAFVAVNHDLDQLLPDLAESEGVQRCALDMMRVQADLAAPLRTPVLTGWSLARYSRFADLPQARTMRQRLHQERPDLAAVDVNQMYTQLPDGTLFVGDTHTVSTAPGPFQAEAAQELLLQETAELFGVPRPTVLERWQGVYAKGVDEFLRREVAPGVVALAATTGIGMTCGLGLAEDAVARALGERTAPTGSTTSPSPTQKTDHEDYTS
ncbi:TIGR03364 family FAD-dependent oxidoreductase [Galactobacter sp.]|uniref:TIGR03364 family FAD-dependent oxidoreductase n=1 Tax=Galactobacter sp. TaxID=2676125 RepID=UPI0025BE0532|nr:TIGR03364 family FAD-dependent oxidoreductase [Galactobacter sp.]